MDDDDVASPTSPPTPVAEHFPGWRWTGALAALAILLYLGLILFHSPASSDFIYFQF